MARDGRVAKKGGHKGAFVGEFEMKRCKTAIVVLCSAVGALVGQGAVISGSVSETSPDNFDLTTYNDETDITVIDWVVWGEGNSTSLTPTTSMSGGSGISNLTDINPYGIVLRGLGQFGDIGGPSFQWTDGTPTASANNVFCGIQHNASYTSNTETGFGLTVDGAVGVSRTLGFWFGSHRGTTRLEVSLNGAETYIYDLVANETLNNAFGFATIEFTPDLAGDQLSIHATLLTNTSSTQTGNTYLFGAALYQSGAVPEPATLTMLGVVFGVGYFIRRRFII